MSEWISVEDRLPEIGDWVLLFVYRGTWLDSNGSDYGKHCCCVGGYKGPRGKDEGWRDNDIPTWNQFGPDYYTSNDVTHWMPLPEPPK